MLRYFILNTLFVLLGFTYVKADKPHTVNFDKYLYQGGNKNWAVAQDAYGVMYFGNDNGLLEFDGIRWKLYTIPEAEVVRAVAITADNRIFTGGFEEFGVWERNQANELVYTSLSKELKKEGGLKNDDIWKIHVTDSVILFQSFSHIFAYDYQKAFVQTEGSNILFLLQVYDEYWIQKTGGSLYRLNGDNLEEIPGSTVFRDTEVRVVLPYAGQRYLVATSTKGFYIYDGQKFNRWLVSPSTVEKYQINSGIQGSNGNYFFGTILNGIYEMTPAGEIVNHFSTHNFLQNNTVLDLFEDDSGDIWAALDRGVSYIQYLDNLDCYIDPTGKTGAIYSATLFDGKLFLGTNQGLFYLPEEQLSGLDPLFDLRLVEGTEGQVWSVKVYGDKLLCGHNYGLRIIDKQLRVITDTDVNRGIYKINPERYNNTDLLFVSTYFVSSILKADLSLLSTIDDIREPIMDIELDHLGNIWMAHTQKGLYRCRFQGDIHSQKLIRMYGVDDNDTQSRRFRIFKLGGRVVFLSDDRFYIYNDINDLLVPFEAFDNCFEGIHTIRQLVPLNHNLFYALTNSSVYKGYYDDEAYLIEKFDVGINHLSLVNAYENAVMLNDSTSMICLDNGFMLHYFRRVMQKQTIEISRPYIRSVETRDTKDTRYYWQPGRDGIRIPNKQHTISFDFFSRNVLKDNLSFQYMLKGETDEWSDPAKVHEIRFERLSKGDYTFYLRTVNSLGDYSEVTPFAFTILPPWYQTGWAYMGYAFCIVLSLTIVWFIILRRYRNVHLLKVRMREEQRLRRQNASLQQVIEEKDAELFSQASFIIQKNELILKVKKEIDDFYNSYSGKKIFLPLYAKISTLLNKNMDIDEDWKMFLIQFEQKHTGFFRRIREVHPDLTTNDLKLCACLRLNLSSKDISSLMNISLRAVENSRYRLRKKLNISSQQNLNDYFMRF